MVDPAWFIAQQIPESVGAGSIWPDAPPAVADPPVASDEGIMVAWQLGNLYLLMALMGVAILHSTSEVKVVRAYLFVLAVGDVGHVGLTAYGVGWDKFARPHEWNAMTMGNITFTVRMSLPDPTPTTNIQRVLSPLPSPPWPPVMAYSGGLVELGR